MPRRKALGPDQWKTAFDEIVADATQELGRVPCMALEETEDGNGALLVASVTTRKTVKKIFDGRGTITNSDAENISAHIYRKEIPTVLKLLREYRQPESDFDANLDFWSLWEEPQAACRNQANLSRWG
jgi:hypothetical protein